MKLVFSCQGCPIPTKKVELKRRSLFKRKTRDSHDLLSLDESLRSSLTLFSSCSCLKSIGRVLLRRKEGPSLSSRLRDKVERTCHALSFWRRDWRRRDSRTEKSMSQEKIRERIKNVKSDPPLYVCHWSECSFSIQSEESREQDVCWNYGKEVQEKVWFTVKKGNVSEAGILYSLTLLLLEDDVVVVVIYRGSFESWSTSSSRLERLSSISRVHFYFCLSRTFIVVWIKEQKNLFSPSSCSSSSISWSLEE